MSPRSSGVKTFSTRTLKGNPLKGPVSGAPAPELGENDYNNYEFAPSRMILWMANQQHLYFGSFVLAVPIFCMLIEFVGIRSVGKVTR